MADSTFLGGVTRNALLAGGTVLIAAWFVGQPVSVLVSDTIGGAFSWARGTIVGYDAAACRKDPVGCLKNEGGKLEVTTQRIETALNQIRPASAIVREIIHAQEAKMAQGDLFLQEGRRLLQAASNPQAPIAFIGVTYPDVQALTRQLRLIFSEQERTRAFMTGARTQLLALQERQEQLLVARGSVQAQLSMIPVQIELARAAGVLGQFEGTLGGIEAAVAGGEERVKGLDDLMRTTDELMRARQAPVAAPDGAANDAAGFDAFLHRNKD